MSETTNNSTYNVNFKWGEYEKLPTDESVGSIYFVTDEKSIYYDTPDGRIRLNTINYYPDSETAIEDITNGLKPPYDPEILYYIEDLNCFIKWKADSSDSTGMTGEWIQVNDFSPVIEAMRSDLQGKIDDANSNIGALGIRLTALDKENGIIAQIQTSINNIKGTSNQSIEDLVSSLNGIGDRTSAIETRLNSFDKSGSDIESVIDEIGSTINTLQTNIGNLSNLMNFVGLIVPSNGTSGPSNLNKPVASIVNVSANTYYKVKEEFPTFIQVEAMPGTNNSMAQIYAAQPGDVAVDCNTKKEVLYTGTMWVEIGDTTAATSAISVLQALTEHQGAQIGSNTNNIKTLQDTVAAHNTTINGHSTTITELQNLLTWQAF